MHEPHFPEHAAERFDDDRPPPMVEPLVVTVDEVAKMLRLSKRSVWRLRSAGVLPAPLRLGNSVRWLKSDIDAWIAGGCLPPAALDPRLRRRPR